MKNLSVMSREELVRLIGQIAQVAITAEDPRDCVLEICDRLEVLPNGDLRQLTRLHEGPASASSEGPAPAERSEDDADDLDAIPDAPDALDAEIGQAMFDGSDLVKLRPMSEAPTIDPVEILVATTDRAGCRGWLIAHFADGGGEDQPRFWGWFYWTGFDFREVESGALLGWLPLPTLDQAIPVATSVRKRLEDDTDDLDAIHDAPDAPDAPEAEAETDIGRAVHKVLDLVGRRAARVTNQNRMNDVARALGWRVDFATGSPITWDKVLTEVARRRRPETRDPVASAMEAWARELDAADLSPHAAGRFLAAEIRRRIAASSPVDVAREVERDA